MRSSNVFVLEGSYGYPDNSYSAVSGMNGQRISGNKPHKVLKSLKGFMESEKAPLEKSASIKKAASGYFYGWNMAIASFFVVFALWGAYYGFSVFFKSMTQEFNWTRAQTSAAMTISLLIGGLTAPIVGRLIDRYGSRLIMAICAILAGAGYIMLSTISSLWEFYLWYGLVIGLAMSGSYVIPAAIINRWFMRRRGLALGLVFSGFGVGQMLVPPLATHLLDTFNWRTSYILIGASVFILTFVAALFLKDSPRDKGLMPDGEAKSAERDIKAAGGFTLREATRTPGYWLLIALWFVFAIPTYIIGVHLIPYATDVKIDPMKAASIFAVIGSFNIAGRIVFGHLCDKWGNKPVVFISFTAVLLGMLIMVGARDLWAFYLAGALYGTFFSAVDIAIIKVTGDFFGVKSIGAIMGTTGLAWRIGAAGGTILAGLIFDITRSYSNAFVLAALSMLLSIVVSFFLFHNKPKLVVS